MTIAPAMPHAAALPDKKGEAFGVRGALGIRGDLRVRIWRRREFQRHTVHAVAQTGRLRSIRKHVAEMAGEAVLKTSPSRCRFQIWSWRQRAEDRSRRR